VSPRLACLPISLAILFAAGCRHVAPQPLSPGQSADRLAARTLADPGLRDFLTEQRGRSPELWPQKRWDLGDLTLAALYFSPDLRVARAEAEVVEAGVGTASQRPNPKLSFLPQRVARPESGLSPWLAAVQLDWPIETAGKRAHRRAAARARASAADLAVRSAEWSLRTAVYEAVASLRAADVRSEWLARSVDLQRERLGLIEHRRAAGEVAESITAPARMALARSTVDLAAAERRRSEARAALATTLGTPPQGLDAIEVAFALEAPPRDLEALGSLGARRIALLGRSDVLARLADYAAAEEDLRLELSKQVPDLHLGPGYEYDQGVDKWGLGVSLELPLVNRNEGAIDEAVARRSAAAARFEALQAQVIGEIATASASLEGARREEASARDQLAHAERAVMLARARLAQGALDRVGLLDAELEAQLAAGALVDAQERVHLAVARLERAVEQPERLAEGTGTQETVAAAPREPR
jgi:outer membrane protein, heavy metal efflux system